MIDWETRATLVMNVLYDSASGFGALLDDDVFYIIYNEARLGFDKEIVEKSSAIAIIMEALQYFGDQNGSN